MFVYFIYKEKLKTMKSYLQFVKEDLEQQKLDIADKVAKNETTKEDSDKQDITEKPNEEIIKDIQTTIKKIEDKKLIIKNKITTFNDQIKLTDTPKEATTLTKNITELQKQLADLDKMLKEKQKDIQKFNK
jgi:hypothetical protein